MAGTEFTGSFPLNIGVANESRNRGILSMFGIGERVDVEGLENEKFCFETGRGVELEEEYKT